MNNPKQGSVRVKPGPKPGTATGNAGKGRKPGAVNKLTKGAKEAIQEAFKGLGGVAALQRWATDNPESFYTKVWVRILPQDINANVTARNMTDEEARQRLDQLEAECE